MYSCHNIKMSDCKVLCYFVAIVLLSEFQRSDEHGVPIGIPRFPPHPEMTPPFYVSVIAPSMCNANHFFFDGVSFIC